MKDKDIKPQAKHLMAFMCKASGCLQGTDSAVAAMYKALFSAFELSSLQEWLDCIHEETFDSYYYALHKTLRQIDVYEGYVKERGAENKPWIIDNALWHLIHVDKGVLTCALAHAFNPKKEPLDDLPNYTSLKHLLAIYRPD